MRARNLSRLSFSPRSLVSSKMLSGVSQYTVSVRYDTSSTVSETASGSTIVCPNRISLLGDTSSTVAARRWVRQAVNSKTKHTMRKI